MTLENIKEAIESLSEEDRRNLANWFAEVEATEWDEEMERDFAPGGRAEHLFAELQREATQVNPGTLEEGLTKRRNLRK